MAIELIQSASISDTMLESLLKGIIGDGQKDRFLEGNTSLKTVLSNNLLDVASSLELGECVVDEVRAVRKIGLVYISDKDLDFIEKNNRIYSIVPNFKYIKDEEEITTIEYITVYGQYKLKVKFDNKKLYEFIIVSYIEKLQ